MRIKRLPKTKETIKACYRLYNKTGMKEFLALAILISEEIRIKTIGGLV